jgi:hypothetical protein
MISRRISFAAIAALVCTVVAARMPMKWTATLAPQGGTSIAGTATVEPAGGQSKATVTLTGGAPNATYPWHVHAGACGGNGKVVGPATAYTPLKTDTYGAAKVTVTLPFAAPDSGSYYVNIHKSPTDMGTIVSCGNLTMAM